MSDFSNEINGRISSAPDNWAIKNMAHAFDLPFIGNNLFGLVSRFMAHHSVKFSLTVEGDKLILGFENPSNGDRLIVSRTADDLDLPEWLSDISMVTCDSSPMRASAAGWRSGVQIVAVVGVNFVALTATDCTEGLVMIDSPLALRGIGGAAIYDADGRYEVNTLAKVTYNTIENGKRVLGKAGRKKPQGELIVYFTNETCAIEGFNSIGESTLTLQTAGTRRQIDSYESNVREPLAVKFSYSTLFKMLFSKRGGILYDAPPGKMSYGVSDTGKPVIEFDFTGSERASSGWGGCVITILQGNDGYVIADDIELPSLSLSGSARRAAPKGNVTTNVKADLDKYPIEYKEMIQEWFDCHVAEQTSRGKVPSDSIDKWFLSFLMKCAVEGTEVSKEARDVFDEVKSL